MNLFFILIFYIFYNVFLFIISDIKFLIVILLFNILLFYLNKITFKEWIFFIKKIFVFYLFILLCNINTSLFSSLFIGLRFLLLINFTFIMSHYFTPCRFRDAIRPFFVLLKIFKIDIDSLLLCITISITFIPTLIKEVNNIKSILKSKGYDITFLTIIKKPQMFVYIFFSRIFKTVDLLERILRTKGI